jgi:hypothetical protein
VDILLKDYREIDGAFDRVVSIEMIEAVGRRNIPACQKMGKLRMKAIPAAVACCSAARIVGDSLRESPAHIVRSASQRTTWYIPLLGEL